MPSVSPGASEKLTPSTAANTLPPERNSVRRSFDLEQGRSAESNHVTGRDCGRRSFVA